MNERTDSTVALDQLELEPIEISDEEILADLMYPHPAYPVSSPAGAR